MEWVVMNMDKLYTQAAGLGEFNCENIYVPAPTAVEKIHEILRRLVQDKARWHFRRILFMNKIISTNLLPTLIHVKKNRECLAATIKLIQELLTPIECLMPIDIMGQNYEGRRIIQELEVNIISSKKLFLDPKYTKALIDFVSELMKEPEPLSMEDCETINYCLLLIRNLLHVHTPSSLPTPSTDTDSDKSTGSGKVLPDRMRLKIKPNAPSTLKIQSVKTNSGENVLPEDQIMWNLFAQKFDNILIRILTCSQQQLWNITMVQLVSLMYREQQQGTIRKLIGEWLESSICESSEDDEGNTMSSSSCDHASSDPISDSSERLSPVDRIEASATDKQQEILKTEEAGNSCNSSERSKSKMDKNSSKDSGFGRSGSNNEGGSSSFDESLNENNSQSNKKENKIQKEGSLESCENANFSTSDGEDKQMVIEQQILETKQNFDGNSELKNSSLENENVTDSSEGRGDTGISMETEMSSLIDSNSPKINEHTNESNATISLNEDNNHMDISPLPKDVIMNSESSNDDERRNHNPIFPTTNKDISSAEDSNDNKPLQQIAILNKPKQSNAQKRSRQSKKGSEGEVINESSNSTGSDGEDGPQAKRPHHQKPHKMMSKPRPAKLMQKSLQERNCKKSKLMKRKETKCIKTKALLHHHPTQDDISNLLKEFTIDFMLNGYSNLVSGLQCQVLLPFQIELDKSHLLWLITYFMRFAVELDLELSQLSPILSSEVVSYLVYEGVVIQEDLEVAEISGDHNKVPQVRRLHLVVTALREFFVSFEIAINKDPSSFDFTQLMRIKDELGNMVQVRQLFVLLIRYYDPDVMTINFLQDLITTNHRFLITQETTVPNIASCNTFNLMEHVRQFATIDIMRQYSRLLVNYDSNEEFVNDCIFTIMHHIAGDLRAVNVLLQPQILRMFTVIWSDSYELCADWADLIEYVLRKCAKLKFNLSQQNVEMYHNSGIILTNDDMEKMYSANDLNESEIMNKIKEVCCDESLEEPIDKEVIKKLHYRGFITNEEYRKLCNELPDFQIKSEAMLEEDITHQRSSLYFDENDGFAYPLPVEKKWPKGFDNLSKRNSLKSSSDDCGSVCDSDVDYDKNTDRLEDHPDNHSSASSKDFTVRSHKGSSSDLGHNDPELEDTNASLDDDTKMSKLGSMDEIWEHNEILANFISKVDADGFRNQLNWLQLELLEIAYAKLGIVGRDFPLPEPVFLHFTVTNQSIPIIPWTSGVETAFKSASFQNLLSHLGFHLPADTGKVFTRVPHFWGPEVLCLIAKRLGPIKRDNLKKSMNMMADLVDQLDEANSNNPIILHQMREFREALVFVPVVDNFHSGMDSSSMDSESDERISICSMENNRSVSASPVSSIDVPMMEANIRDLPFALPLTEIKDEGDSSSNTSNMSVTEDTFQESKSVAPS